MGGVFQFGYRFKMSFQTSGTLRDMCPVGLGDLKGLRQMAEDGHENITQVSENK